MRALRQAQPSAARLQTGSALDIAEPARARRAAARRARLGLRIRVRLGRWRLDRQIAAGGLREGGAELELRSSQLTAPDAQRALARNLRRIIAFADTNPSRPSLSAVVIEPAAVRRGRAAMVELAEQLERAPRVDARGILLARALLTDVLSPVFDADAERSLTEAVREVQSALDARR